jgi:sulfur-carrier protein
LRTNPPFGLSLTFVHSQPNIPEIKGWKQTMVRVEFLGPIQKDAMELDITNLSELAPILQQDKELQEWLSNSAVAVNDALVASLEHPLKDGDKISLLPPVCGG